MKLIEEYLGTLYLKQFSTETIVGYEGILKSFNSYCLDNELEILDFTFENTKHYVQHLQTRDLKAVSINNYCSAIRLFFNHLVLTERIRINHFLRIRGYRILEAVPPSLSISEIKLIFSKIDSGATYASTRDIAMFELFYGSGIRPVELSQLRLLNIEFNREEIVVIRPGRQANRSRSIPLPAGTIYLLKLYLAGRKLRWPVSDYLFPGRNGGILSTSTIYNAISTFLIHTSARKKGALTIRNTYARHLLEAGADVYQVKRLLGHQGLAATLRQQGISTYNLLEVYRKSHPKA